jgi:hypothetical protein
MGFAHLASAIPCYNQYGGLTLRYTIFLVLRREFHILLVLYLGVTAGIEPAA